MEITAQTPHHEPPDGDPGDWPAQAAAVNGLRDLAQQRWVQISDRVIAGALSATRRSLTIRAEAASGPVQVSEQVLLTYLRDAITQAVPPETLAHITLQIEGRDTLSGVLIQLVAQYGVPLLPLADHVRELTASCVHDLLGPVDMPVTVSALHIHFRDVVNIKG